jgi:hypothetical protein
LGFQLIADLLEPVLAPNEKAPHPEGERRFELGVDQPAITARGTALACLPVDRPHDPGDAADLSIMGFESALGHNLPLGSKLRKAKRKSIDS